MSKKWETIYLDWDGVIWDFKQAFCDWVCIPVPDTSKWEFYESIGMDVDRFHEILSDLPQEFWQQEKYILPHAQDLVAWARRNAGKVSILTVAPEWTTAQGKKNLAHKHFDLGVYTVACAEKKVEFAREGCLLIDDKPSTVVKFCQEEQGAGGFIWPADYNQGLDESWYFDWAAQWPPRKEEKPTKAEEVSESDRFAGTIHDVNLYDYSGKLEKSTLDYSAMDEAKKRKMTPMYSGLLAYFPDALALVAQNSMVGHYQHNDPNEPMYWDRSKSADEMDAMIRHMADHSKDPYDGDGRLHMSKVAWRALAFLQKFIEEQQNDDN